MTRQSFSRRSFLRTSFATAGILAVGGKASAEVIPGFEKTDSDTDASKVWQPISDRKVKVGIVGYGLCEFGGWFSFQDHPNVEVVAVSDLIPERCQGLAKACRCNKTYPSLEELVKDKDIEAVFVATDAPNHAKHCIDVLNHGKHVACAVPAVFGSLEDADKLYEAVKDSGLNYMLFETSAFHRDVYAMRKIYNDGGFGKMIYTEGEYYHYMATPLPSYNDWRVGLVPQWYPTHSNGYYVCVTGGSFTEVSCMAAASILDQFKPSGNRYKNPFDTEVALFRTSEGGMARMVVSWGTPGYAAEAGRARGQKGSMYGMNYQGQADISKLDLVKPPLPPKVEPGYHDGSHGYLADEFISSILEKRTPLVNIAWALNMTVAGVVAHQSALKDGELLKIPQYKL